MFHKIRINFCTILLVNNKFAPVEMDNPFGNREFHLLWNCHPAVKSFLLASIPKPMANLLTSPETWAFFLWTASLRCQNLLVHLHGFVLRNLFFFCWKKMERIRDNLGLIFCPNWDPPILANWYVHNNFLTKILSEWFFARHGSILFILGCLTTFKSAENGIIFCLFLLVLLLSKGDQSVVWRVPNMSEW